MSDFVKLKYFFARMIIYWQFLLKVEKKGIKKIIFQK